MTKNWHSYKELSRKNKEYIDSLYDFINEGKTFEDKEGYTINGENIQFSKLLVKMCTGDLNPLLVGFLSTAIIAVDTTNIVDFYYPRRSCLRFYKKGILPEVVVRDEGWLNWDDQEGRHNQIYTIPMIEYIKNVQEDIKDLLAIEYVR